MISKKGCLIIHGFGGGYFEIEHLAEYLKAKGYLVACPSLTGHTGKRDDLKGVSYLEWLQSAEDSLNTIIDQCDECYVAGFSMGGLIAMNLCNSYNLKKLVTINTPIYCWDIKNILGYLRYDMIHKTTIYITKYIRSIFKYPMSAMYNFRLFLYKTKKIINNVRIPALVIQAKGDDTVKVKSGKYIYEHLGSKYKKLNHYERSNHVILNSEVYSKVCEDIYDFLEEDYND